MSYLTEAFRQLNLTESAFSLENSEDMENAKNFLADDSETVKNVNVYDMDAETEEDMEDSYVGKIILECPICHTLTYKSKYDITFSDDDTEYVNVDEECPMCLSTEGFSIIGKVCPFSEEEESEENIEEEPSEESEENIDVEYDEESDDDIEDVSEEGEEIEEESLREGKESSGSVTPLNSLEKVKDFCKGFKNLSFLQKDEGETYWKEYSNKGKFYGYSEGDKKYLVQVSNGKVRECVDNTGRDYKCPASLKDILVDKNIIEESLREGFNNVDITTDDSKLTMSQDPNGKVTVTTEPLDSENSFDDVEVDDFDDDFSGDTTIGPLSDEDEEEINASAEANAEESEEETENEESEEEPEESEENNSEEEEDIEDIEDFDTMGESYLRNVYDNVKSYKTTSISETPEGKLMFEGIIKFNSGNSKLTKFIFEAKDKTARGKVRFLGENLNITRGHKAFCLTGSIKGKKFISESLKYNYMINGQNIKGKVVR